MTRAQAETVESSHLGGAPHAPPTPPHTYTPHIIHHHHHQRHHHRRHHHHRHHHHRPPHPHHRGGASQGHLAKSRKTGGLLLRESAQCPDADEKAFQDVNKHKFFNTNNLWINIAELQASFDKFGGALPLPVRGPLSTPRSAVAPQPCPRPAVAPQPCPRSAVAPQPCPRIPCLVTASLVTSSLVTASPTLARSRPTSSRMK